MAENCAGGGKIVEEGKLLVTPHGWVAEEGVVHAQGFGAGAEKEFGAGVKVWGLVVVPGG